jgi:hypothetical protein
VYEVKVRVVTVVEVDGEKWRQVAGIAEGTKPRPVQDDLRKYVEGGIVEGLNAMGMIQEAEATVEIREE